jgi:ATP-dependent exoDNAse (exonuclease V) beta subunit
MLHRAVADWPSLALPAHELQPRLIAYARREGVLQPAAILDATERCQAMINALRRSPLYAEITAAEQRIFEVPFSHQTNSGLAYGLIDLLYQDAAGEWRLVEWKVGWPDAANAEEHRRQLQIYCQAARQALGVEPRGTICYLGREPHVVELDFLSQRESQTILSAR